MQKTNYNMITCFRHLLRAATLTIPLTSEASKLLGDPAHGRR